VQVERRARGFRALDASLEILDSVGVSRVDAGEPDRVEAPRCELVISRLLGDGERLARKLERARKVAVEDFCTSSGLGERSSGRGRRRCVARKLDCPSGSRS
jgi:hypothetical protein